MGTARDRRAAGSLVVLGGLTVMLMGLPLLILLVVGITGVVRWRKGHSHELRAMGAAPADRDVDADLFRMVRELAEASGLPEPELHISDQPIANAFAIRTRKAASICVTRQLVESLSDREVRSVLAHEFGHIQNRDGAVSFLFAR